MNIGFSSHYEGYGGARTWIRNFSQYCISKGHKVSFGCDPTVDVFCSVANLSKIQELEIIKKNNIKILQRLGAIYLNYNYPDINLTKTKNKNLMDLIMYSDSIIYQSIFSKTVLFNSLYNGKEPNGNIIYNSTNTSMFNPIIPPLDKKPKNKKLIIAVAYWGTPNTATYSMEIFLKIADMYRYNKDIEFWVLGRGYKKQVNLINKSNNPIITKKNLYDPIDYRLMPQYLRTADLILHLKANEACSNLVIESMHTGTPLVGIGSGSLPELVNDAALLASCKPNLTSFPEVDIRDLKEKIDITLANLDLYKNKMLERAKFFSASNTYDKYLVKLKNLVNE